MNNQTMKFITPRLLIWSLVPIALLSPLIAMQFTSEVVWTLSDFAIFAVLLIATGIAMEVTFRFVRQSKFKWAVCIAIIAAFFVVWAELAVGLFN